MHVPPPDHDPFNPDLLNLLQVQPQRGVDPLQQFVAADEICTVHQLQWQGINNLQSVMRQAGRQHGHSTADQMLCDTDTAS